MSPADERHAGVVIVIEGQHHRGVRIKHLRIHDGQRVTSRTDLEPAGCHPITGLLMVEDLVDGAGEVTHCGQGGVAAEVFQLKDEVRGRASPSTQVQTISVGSCLVSPWPEHCSFSPSIDQPRTDLIWTLQPGFGQKKTTSSALLLRSKMRALSGFSSAGWIDRFRVELAASTLSASRIARDGLAVCASHRIFRKVYIY